MKTKILILTIFFIFGCATNIFAPIPIEERQSEKILEVIKILNG